MDRSEALIAALTLALVDVAGPWLETALARLFAVLAGGVVITSASAELPRDREGRFWFFALGAVGYAALLIWPDDPLARPHWTKGPWRVARADSYPGHGDRSDVDRPSRALL